MTESDKKIFLNKLRLNKIWFEAGPDKIVFGPAKKEYGFTISHIYLPIIAGLVFIVGGLIIYDFGKLKFGLFISGIGFWFYAYRSSGIHAQKKKGNKNYKIIEDGTITIVENGVKNIIDKNSISHIRLEQKEVLDDLYKGKIVIVGVETEFTFLELSDNGAVADLGWISKLLAKEFGISEQSIERSLEKYDGIPLLN